MSVLPGGFLKTRIARRLFVLFVLSAFLPLAAMAVLSLTQTRSLLLQQGEQRLASLAKSYGMTLFERLLLASDVAVSAASQPASAPRPESLPARTFRWLAEVDAAGNAIAILGTPEVPWLPAEARERLASGKPVVMVGRTPGRMLLATTFPQDPRRVVMGELRPESLWGPADELPAATEFCVVEDASRRTLYCSAPQGEAALNAALEATTTRSSRWQRDGEAYLTRTWAQFMRAGFGTPDWLVVASQPESHQLARLAEFQRLFVPVVLLALLLVTWLTIRQSRNIVAPVTMLAERARGVADNDFRGRLAFKRDDEFGELATAFDNMADRLGRQFASLTALSEIDRLILSTQDTTQIISTVLQRLGEVVPADLITVTLFDHDNDRHANTYYLAPHSGDSASMSRHEVAVEDRLRLGQDSSSQWMSIERWRRLPAYLSHAQVHGMATAYVQPIVWRGDVCGAIVLGYRSETATTQEERQRARELADRVAVAVSSAWRDEQLYLQAHFDPLTGAPNRLLFKDRLALEIVRSEREGLTFALLFIDIDHFKNVNDSFGHTMGDKVLREAATRIAGCIRATDTVARLGGDEFTVMATNLAHPQEAWLIAEAIVAALSQEFAIGDQQCFLSASIGIASYPADGASAEELLKSADTAMYRAKAGGRAQAVFFEERMNAEAVARLTLDRDLRMAMDNGELELHFQPQMELATGRICGAEALVRWNHPTRGMIPPVRFIPLAEESGFIEQLGHWTLEQACQQMKRWRAEGLELQHVSVNVSPRQFRRRTLVDFIRNCVEDAGLPASSLQIEITEGLLLDRGEAVESMLAELAAMGHEIALDDFGTGFSSMSYLKRFPVHTIKIDRVFIEGLDGSADSQAIVSAIIAMSHALGKTVIAEGVETPEQLAQLRKVRCDEVQGFIVAQALPPAEFARLAMAHGRETLTA